MVDRLLVCVFFVAIVVSSAIDGSAQTISQRGFVDGSTVVYPQTTANDDVRVVGDVLGREDAIVKPAVWIQFAAGLDFRANSHGQVDDSWELDFSDRTRLRPRLSVRRLSATLHRGPFTIDVGKQFIRWGKTDIVTPTDRFAPRDFLNVIDAEFLAVTGVRGTVQAGHETFDAVWVPRFTPSRMPIVDQRWTPVPAGPIGIAIVDVAAPFPDGAQSGLRWSHLGRAVEFSASFFDGFNHLPNIAADVQTFPSQITVARVYPAIRTYGVDAAVPIRWFTIKGEAAYFTSRSVDTDEYVLYVLQLERQSGEWVFIGGYAGEALTTRGAVLTFAPDRGLSRSIVARASYTIDPNRRVAFETAVRENGSGVYAKAEYSQARGQHWRATLTGVLIAGDETDFLGQYERNSHARVALRYSF
jgi:hypothetical protein